MNYCTLSKNINIKSQHRQSSQIADRLVADIPMMRHHQLPDTNMCWTPDEIYGIVTCNFA